MANGKNGNIVEGYWSNRNKPDWSLVFALCGIIGTLLGALWVENEKKVDYKIELAKRDARIFILENQKTQISPSGYRY